MGISDTTTLPHHPYTLCHFANLAFLPPKASPEWLWVPEVVLYIIQAPLLPGHYTSQHVPHWVQQTANFLDTLDRPTGPAPAFQHVCLHH